jgi:hypothetical protein
MSAGSLGGAVLAAASVVVLHGAAMLLVAMAAALAAAAAAEATDGGRAAAAAAAWKAATLTVTAIVFVAGLAVLVGGAVAAIAAPVCAVAAGVVFLLRGRPVRKTWRPASVPVAQLPTSALGSEWRRTTVALADPLDPTTRHAVVQRRQETLDELERRDPIGFTRWLAVEPSPASDPARFVDDNGASDTDTFGGQQ